MHLCKRECCQGSEEFFVVLAVPGALIFDRLTIASFRSAASSCLAANFCSAHRVSIISSEVQSRERHCISRIARMGPQDRSFCPILVVAVVIALVEGSPFVQRPRPAFAGKCVSPHVVASGDTTRNNSSTKRTVACSGTETTTTTAVRPTRLPHRLAFLWCRCHFASRAKSSAHVLRIKDLSVAR